MTLKSSAKNCLAILSLIAISLAIPEMANAHFQMLLPSAASGSTDQEITVTYQWGHPYEHQLFDAPKPESVVAVAPDGTRFNLSERLRKTEVPGEGNRAATAFQVSFTPRQRGDHVLTLTTAPIWMNEEKLFLQDEVKTIFHVQTQNGWDAAAGLAFEIMPLTRPYGLIPGIVFQGRVLVEGKPLADAIVEVERYNLIPPKVLPSDEQITRSVKCDPNGTFTCTLTEPGWWCVTATKDGGKRARDGNMYPVKKRTTLWVFVDEKPGK
jgi:cobalt/nickel transport protein